MNIPSILKEKANKFSNKTALVFKDTAISFTQLRDFSFSLANGLESLGVGKPSRIGIFLPNCPEYAYSCFAAFSIGATIVPLDYLLKIDELTSCLSHAEVEALIVIYRSEIDWDQLKNKVPTLKHVIVLGERQGKSYEVDFYGLMKKGDRTSASVMPDDPAMLMYTSGTTGAPKGIVLTYQHLKGSPEAMNHFVDLTDKDVKLCAIPLSHIGGFIYLQNCVLFGITVVLMDRYHPLDFLRLIQQYKVTCFHIVPPMYTAMLTVKTIDQFDLTSLRWAVVFGAPSSPDILERFHRYCPNAKLLNGWGMTETCPPNTVTPLDNPNIASVGKPAPHCDMAVVDDFDQPLPTGQVGEIVIRGWVVMKEYFKDPQLTAETKRNGWFHTGDLGRFDQDGLLYIVGRKKEMIKVAGQIVFEPEVEMALCKHEAVMEAAVVGVPDSLRGEIVQAFVVLKEGAAVDALQLKYFLKDHLANFKVPHHIDIRTSLPKNRTGKIDKVSLRESLVLDSISKQKLHPRS